MFKNARPVRLVIVLSRRCASSTRSRASRRTIQCCSPGAVTQRSPAAPGGTSRAAPRANKTYSVRQVGSYRSSQWLSTGRGSAAPGSREPRTAACGSDTSKDPFKPMAGRASRVDGQCCDCGVGGPRRMPGLVGTRSRCRAPSAFRAPAAERAGASAQVGAHPDLSPSPHAGLPATPWHAHPGAPTATGRDRSPPR